MLRHEETKHRRRSKRSPNPDQKQARQRTEQHGLFLLSSPANAFNDVIAIHGLGGDAFTTWTDKRGHMWLRDMLPDDLPHSRIWTYGYDSAVAWSGSVSGIQDFARDLLERLLDIRSSPEETHRPLIFICHSLGGLVIKKALILAKLVPAYEPVRCNVKAIVFMGTPHKGSRVSSYIYPLTRIVNALLPGSPIRADLIGNLQVLSQTLSEVSEMSVQALSEVNVISFYEQKKIAGTSTLVVEPASAILCIENERAIPINADHRNMVRFSPDEPEKYRPMKIALKSLVSKIEKDESQHSPASEYLQKLYCIDYENLLTESIQPFPGTGNWLFENQSFRAWAQEPCSGICLVRGNTGFGKTVVARSMVENSKMRTTRVVDLAPFGSSLILHYFFRSEKVETLSQLSLVRSLLHQILLEFPSIWFNVEYHHSSIMGVAFGKRRELRFRSDWLWNALEDVLSQPRSQNTLLVLDALDEASTEELIPTMKQLAKIVRSLNLDQPAQCVKIVVFSRPNYHLDNVLSEAEVTVLEMARDKTSSDLSTFISAVVPKYGRDHNFPESAILQIQDQILTGADGMFLWANLAWEHFKQGVNVWNRAKINSQLKSLGQLPRGLEALYSRILTSIDKSAMTELKPIFILVCAAGRPLGCDELGDILAIETWHRSSSEMDAPFAIETTLLRLCPNLFKIDIKGTVSFVHLSLRTFLQDVLLRLDSKVIHRYLVTKSFTYFGLEDFKEDAITDSTSTWKDGCSLRQRHLLYDYFASYLKFHLEQVPYTDPIWVRYSKTVGDHDVFRAIASPAHFDHVGRSNLGRFYIETPLRHALRLGALDLVRRFVQEGYDIDEKVVIDYSTRSTALHANIKDQTKALLLLELGADPNARDEFNRSALHLAVYCTVPDLVTELLTHPKIDVNAEDIKGETPLHYQVTSGSSPTLLYDQRVNVGKVSRNGFTAMALSALWGDANMFRKFVELPDFNIASHKGLFSPLICAAQQDWRDLTFVLIHKVPDANTHRGLDGKSIVHWAVINEWDDILLVSLTRAKAKVNALDHSGKTALHYAAKLGLDKIVRLLLRHGASARIQDVFGRTAVHTAAVEGFADVLGPLLSESDFDPADADEQHRSLIHWAASCDWGYLMKTVLEIPEIDPKKRDHHGRNASHIAALCGCPNVLRALIEYGAFEATATDGFGNTALHLAARGRSQTSLEILLPYFTLLRNHVNRWGQTARDVALVYASYDVAVILQHAGVTLQAPPVNDFSPSVDPSQKQDTPEVQEPNYLALVRHDPDRAYERIRNREREDSHERYLPERSRENESAKYSERTGNTEPEGRNERSRPDERSRTSERSRSYERSRPSERARTSERSRSHERSRKSERTRTSERTRNPTVDQPDSKKGSKLRNFLFR